MPRPLVRLARKTIARWREWRFERAHPEIAMLKRARKEAQSQHRATRPYDDAMKRLVLARLRLEAPHADR